MPEFSTFQTLSLSVQRVLIHLHLINIPCNFPSKSRQTMLILSYLVPMAYQKKNQKERTLFLQVNLKPPYSF